MKKLTITTYRLHTKVAVKSDDNTRVITSNIMEEHHEDNH